jgi:2-methylcitrate dehydratase PrpD
MAIHFIRTQGGTPEAQVIGTDYLTTAINASMANGFLAHADETDDQHGPSFTHPGAAIIPAALAVAERENASGEAFLRSVVTGYDVCCRIARFLVTGGNRPRGHATHSVGGTFGATASAAILVKLNPRQVRHALAYAGQQASGVTTWVRDEEHVEKAFVFGGMGARNGVTGALFVQQGFSGEEDVFGGEGNFLEAFCPSIEGLPKWIDNLGSHFEIIETNIKRFPVGFPIQAPADALTTLIQENKLTVDQVKSLDVHLPPQAAQLVNNRSMPDVNCQYIMATMLLDGRLTFEAAHTYERMNDLKVLEIKRRINLIGDQRFAAEEKNQPAMVRVHLADGRTLEKYVPAFKGKAENPMNREEIAAKELDLIQGILGKERSAALIQAIWDLDKMESVRALRPLLNG